MASLLPANGVLFETTDVAPSPSKDYCQVVLTKKEVTYRWWKISCRSDAKHVSPSEIKDSHEDFLYDERIKNEIKRVFGRNTLDYLARLAQGQLDYFPRLSNSLIIHVIKFLDLEDINRLSQVSKQFRQICSSEDLWEKIYHLQSGSNVTPELQSLAQELGWKKLFFTNKLQLQVQLRRSRQKKISTSRRQGEEKSSSNALVT